MILAGVAFVLMLAKAPAAVEPPKEQKRTETSVAAGEYTLGPDDVISITVVNFPNLSASALTIPPDGKIKLQLLEPILATGKTVVELGDALTTAWTRFVIKPSVSVSLSRKRQDSVVIYGFAARVGSVEFRPNMHLLEAIATGGGFQATADPTHVTLTRRTGEKQVLDISHPETKSGTAVDVALQPGDIIFVPEKHTQVTVLGEVTRPGSIDFKEEMTVLEVMTASGPAKDTADLASSTLQRDGKEMPLDLDALMRLGDTSKNLKLQAGDRIMVPEITNRTYVFGAVGHVGYYNFRPGDKVMDAIVGSGGPLQSADLGKINVIRKGPDPKDKTRFIAIATKVDVDKYLKHADPKGNVALQAGDVLFVPDKVHKFGFQDVWQGIMGAASLRNVVRLVGF